MVSIFAAMLILIIGFVVKNSYSDQDTVLDAHEYYYYSRYEEKKEYPIYCRKHKNLGNKEEIILSNKDKNLPFL